jgi:hypothetical protein
MKTPKPKIHTYFALHLLCSKVLQSESGTCSRRGRGLAWYGVVWADCWLLLESSGGGRGRSLHCSWRHLWVLQWQNKWFFVLEMQWNRTLLGMNWWVKIFRTAETGRGFRYITDLAGWMLGLGCGLDCVNLKAFSFPFSWFDGKKAKIHKAQHKKREQKVVFQFCPVKILG